MKAIRIMLPAILLAVLLTRSAGATFHLMQVEQVIGGVGGTTSVQAVQLRMRSFGQDLVQQGRLLARDAAGANPVLLIDFPTPVSNGQAGDRVLVATSNFSSFTSPPVTPDFVFTNPIPASYLAAGSLTFEDNLGTIYWRLSWGGSSYTGSGLGSITNDADGNFNPPFPGPLPSTTEKALRFKNGATALSTNNSNDYALTTGAAIFTNNAGSAGTITNIVGVGGGPMTGPLMLSPPAPNPVRDEMAYGVVLPHDAWVQVRLLDIGGRVVRTLLDRALPAGRHGFAWRTSNNDGPALSSGLYFVELRADGAIHTRRVAVIK